MGITNGCIDSLYEMPEYPHMAFNNTYGLETIPKEVYKAALDANYQTGGCQDQTLKCRELGAQGDPLELGNNATVNEACAAAFAFCFSKVQGVYAVSNVSIQRHTNLLPLRFALLTNGWIALRFRYLAYAPRDLPSLVCRRLLQSALGAASTRCPIELHIQLRRSTSSLRRRHRRCRTPNKSRHGISAQERGEGRTGLWRPGLQM
jgi:hypothetical protein